MTDRPPLTEFGPPSEAQRVTGLKYVAEVRQLLETKAQREYFISHFFNSIRGRNRAMIFYLARIPQDRHSVKYEDLTEEEKKKLDDAMRDLLNIAEIYDLTLKRAPRH